MTDGQRSVDRLVAVLAIVVALAALAVAGFALRHARRADNHARRAEARARVLGSEVRAARYALRSERAKLRSLDSTAATVRALCHAARHASIPPATVYAVTVARSIIRGIVASCDYGHMPD